MQPMSPNSPDTHANIHGCENDPYYQGLRTLDAMLNANRQNQSPIRPERKTNERRSHLQSFDRLSRRRLPSSPSNYSRGGLSNVREFQLFQSLNEVIDQAQDQDLNRLRRQADDRLPWQNRFANDPILTNQ